MFGRDKSTRRALPASKTVHGIEVKKMPVGKYLDASERMGSIVMDLIDEVFPGKTPGEILQSITTISAVELRALFMRLLSIAPQKLLAVMAAILDVDVAVLRDDLSPAELMRVWKAFWGINDLTDFFTNVRSIVLPMMRTGTKNTGSSGLQPPAVRSE